MILSKLRRRRSSSEGAARRPQRQGTGIDLPPTPLDGGVVSCQVHDERGSPLPEATVTVVDRLNQQVGQGKTDSYGFYLATVPPGVHKVSITAGGYLRAGARADVRTNRHTSIGNVQLEPDTAVALPQPGTWRFDPDHTEARFIAQHIGMSKIHGAFRDLDGYIQVASPFEQSRIEVTIDASSIDTGVKMRDDHLRSPDFLDVANHPNLHFTSDRITPMRGDRWLVSGSLMIRGTTSPVQLDTTYLGQRAWNGTRAACLCETELRREDYAVNWQEILNKGIAVVGPTVRIELDVQAVLDE
ncbi:polyisoprenoid-binding protein YceI [Halopolyspora algeriensis]|uniref:Polyisoprenoid-binding protein YceI n=1 Tax=Halopolyspora algeriensis TaxID=1500506 RepID=A0A368W458_9ACTN|nr:YceI family protein [Halopolyspora algeriensis]RCW46850.1 polyisoprenoid-binding protein YceI [Halopolyspora algeriensis]TQM47941.1 polyisoprenoid-binding protein YceI [Halopolyspora algeriensis]